MFHNRKLAILVVLMMIAPMVLAACGPTPEPQVIEKIVTQVVEQTVKETVIVEGTPEVVEKVVTEVVDSAHVEIVPSQQMAQTGRFSASASVCGLELRVYRLIAEEDAGASVALRQGDRLMVALAGNATTGFQWENVLLYEYAVLRETQEMEYREEPHPETMVGSGGTFLFRYEAIDVGPQSFRFAYHRPWESVEPEQVVEFTATVY